MLLGKYGKLLAAWTTPFESRFVKNNWKLSKIAGSSQKISDVSKQLAQEWKQCDESEKAAFKSEARKEGEDRRSYFDNLPVNEKEDLEQKSSQHKLSILKRERRSINREINQKTSRPSKPPSAYNLYVKDKLKNRSSGESQTLSQRVTAVALEWKNLPDLDKEKYTSQAAIFAKGYQEKLIKWKEETETVAREIRLENKEKLLKLSQKIKQLELKMPVKGA